MVFKEESTTEILVFGAKFVAMKVGVDALYKIKDKFRMMDIPTSRSTYIYGYSMLVFHNISKQESRL